MTTQYRHPKEENSNSTSKGEQRKKRLNSTLRQNLQRRKAAPKAGLHRPGKSSDT